MQIKISSAVTLLILSSFAAGQGPAIGGGCGCNCPGPEILVAARSPALGLGIISRFCEADGCCIDDAFIVLRDAPLPGGTRFPVEPRFSDPPFPGPASQSQEVWTTDRDSDNLHRHSSERGCELGEFGAQLDDVRGFTFADGRLWVTNHGMNGGAPGDALQVFDSGLPPGSPPTMTVLLPYEPYDVTEVPGVAGGLLLVSNVTDHNIESYDFNGTFLGTFHDSDGVTGVNFPKQISLSRDGTSVFVAGFEGAAGVYKYDLNGIQIDFLDVQIGFAVNCTSGVNGVFELGNGNVMWTCNKGIFIFVPGTQSFRALSSIFDAQFIGPFDPVPLITLGSRSCLAFPNTTGCGARIFAEGSTSVSANDLVLRCQTVPVNQFGIFFYGPEPAFTPFGHGLQCVGEGTTGFGRLDVENSGSHGILTHAVDNTMPPFPAVQILPGSTWFFTTWYRDPLGPGDLTPFNLSDRVELNFTP